MTDPPYILAAPPAAQPLLRRALADLGLHEEGGPNRVPELTEDDPRPWCAVLARRWLHDCGVLVKGSDSARELLRQLGPWSIPHDGELRPGDVVGWQRYEAGQVVGSHVAVVLAAGKGWVDVIAGNSGVRSDRVAISLISPAKVEWAARPMG